MSLQLVECVYSQHQASFLGSISFFCPSFESPAISPCNFWYVNTEIALDVLRFCWLYMQKIAFILLTKASLFIEAGVATAIFVCALCPGLTGRPLSAIAPGSFSALPFSQDGITFWRYHRHFLFPDVVTSAIIMIAVKILKWVTVCNISGKW